jgi:hypothetical protein
MKILPADERGLTQPSFSRKLPRKWSGRLIQSTGKGVTFSADCIPYFR